MQEFHIKCYLEVEENLRALGYSFFSVKSFFQFTEENLTTIIFDYYFDVYLNYESEENKGLFVCRIYYPENFI